MCENKNGISNEIKKELLNPSIDLTEEYLELGIDSFLSEGIFKEIPIVKTLYSVYKIGNSIKDAHFVKKLMVFLKEFNSGAIEQDKLDRFKEKLNKDENYKKKTTEQMIILIDRYDYSFKAAMYGRLFIAYINEYYNWDTFQYLSSCTDNLFINDFRVLEILYKAKDGKTLDSLIINNNDNKYIIIASIEKLKSCGLAEDDQITDGIIKAPMKRTNKISDLGNKFYKDCVLNQELE